MDNQVSHVLQQLKDIHLPTPIHVWPLAPGWYVVIVIVALFLFVCLLKTWVAFKQRRAKKQALKELHDLKIRYAKPGQSQLILIELSALLRRIAIVSFPDQKVAGLYGMAWMQFLDNVSGRTDFTQGVGQLLMSAPYQRYKVDDAQALFACVQTWIKRAC